jgi:protein TonB
MAYLQHSNWRERPGAVVAVIAIHGVVGYALISGLSFTKIIEAIDNPDAVEVTVPIDPLPPPPEDKLEPDPKVIENPVVAPLPPVDLGPQRPPLDATVIIPPLTDIVPKVIPSPTPGPTARPSPVFDPVAASPRNNPGSWVTTDDYRSSWINREMVGTARFRLQIAANGKVETCTITGSSGHAELDKATCDLVTRRARFDPAKDASGAKVSGSYSSSVRWQLPE